MKTSTVTRKELHSTLEQARDNIAAAQIELGFAAEYDLVDNGVDAELAELVRELEEVRNRLRAVQVIAMNSGEGDER